MILTAEFLSQGADVNHYNSGGSASTPSSILKRLLANPDEPARPEWARKTASAEAVAAAPLPSPRQPTNTTVNAEAAQIVRKRVSLGRESRMLVLSVLFIVTFYQLCGVRLAENHILAIYSHPQ